jgi:hypothetical protein
MGRGMPRRSWSIAATADCWTRHRPKLKLLVGRNRAGRVKGMPVGCNFHAVTGSRSHHSVTMPVISPCEVVGAPAVMYTVLPPP